MHELGISAAVKRTRKPTTSSDLQARFAPNTLKRDFAAELPNVKWVTDTNAVETAEGWLYVAAIFWGNSTKSAQNRLRDFRQAEVTYGYEYLGPLGNFARWGNRAPHVETASKKLLQAFLKNHYAVPQPKRAAAVYALYREECLKQKISPVSLATFYRERKQFTTPEVTVARRGKRAAYQERPWFFYLDQTRPRHGERPFAIAHLDHTQLDIALVPSITGKPLARPWLTFLTDATVAVSWLPMSVMRNPVIALP